MRDVWLTPCPCCRSAERLTVRGKTPLIQVVNTEADGTARIRYLGCRRCGYRPRDNKRVISLDFAPSRRERLSA